MGVKLCSEVTAGEISHTFEVLSCGCVLLFSTDLTGNTFSSLITHTCTDMRHKKESFPVSLCIWPCILNWLLYVEKLQVSLDHSITFSHTSEHSYDPQKSNSRHTCTDTGALVSIPKMLLGNYFTVYNYSFNAFKDLKLFYNPWLIHPRLSHEENAINVCC